MPNIEQNLQVSDTTKLNSSKGDGYKDISSAHLSLSSGANFHGAKLFSVLLNIPFHSCGALLSSIIKSGAVRE